MPQEQWSAKRERQYEHIKDGRDHLYEEARRKIVRGRSSMSKKELEQALER